jgi:dipeptidase E
LPPEGLRRAGCTPTIFAMGGGGFTMEPENPSLDEYVLSLAPVREPRICLLPTAGGDSDDQIHRFYTAFRDRLCEPSHVSLFRLGALPVPLSERLLAQDIIYVGGGSMVNLLALWHAHGLDEILREAWHGGVVLAGISAGSMCWFQHGITKSSGAPAPSPGLGFLPGSNSVHYDGEPERRPVYLAAVQDGTLPAGYGVQDGVGLLFRGTRLAEVVSSQPQARAYRVASGDGGPLEHELEPRVLARARHEESDSVPLAVSELRQAHAARARRERPGMRRSFGRD